MCIIGTVAPTSFRTKKKQFICAFITALTEHRQTTGQDVNFQRLTQDIIYLVVQQRLPHFEFS